MSPESIPGLTLVAPWTESAAAAALPGRGANGTALESVRESREQEDERSKACPTLSVS